MRYKELVNSLFEENKIFNKLTEEQRNAVFSKIGPTCINSGAGTGKTHVLVNRFYHLINKNIDPKRILIVAFTNRAVGEIRKRIQNDIELSDDELIYIKTFHSLFLEILKKDIDKVDENLKDFNTINGEAKESILKDICGSMDLGKFSDSIGIVISALKKTKNFYKKLEELSKKFQISEDQLENIYLKYSERLEDLRGLDFDDYEIKTRDLIKQHEDVRKYWSGKFDAICIDEFQDISQEQLEIIKQITNPNYNIFVVGDPDQNIYGFRDINSNSLFDDFLNHFENVSILNLQQNFRSTQNILKMANSSMEKHPKHKKLYKQLWSNCEEGKKVIYKKFEKSDQEISWVIETINRLVEEKNVDIEEMAILSRNNLPIWVQENLCQELKIRGLDVVSNGLNNNFLNLKEIEFVIAVLNIVFLESTSYHHFYSFLSAFYFKKEINFEEIKVFCKWCIKNNYSFSKSIENIENSQISKRESSILKKIGRSLLSKKEMNKDKKIGDLISKFINYENFAPNKLFYRNNKRMSNVWTFIRKLKNYENTCTKKELIKLIPTINFDSKKYLQTQEEQKAGITISTIHKSKGLEFEYVFLIGMCSRYFPNSTKVVDKNEERRVAHVAYTRAKKQLIITCPTLKENEESEFIDDDIKNSSYFLEI